MVSIPGLEGYQGNHECLWYKGTDREWLPRTAAQACTIRKMRLDLKKSMEIEELKFTPLPKVPSKAPCRYPSYKQNGNESYL